MILNNLNCKGKGQKIYIWSKKFNTPQRKYYHVCNPGTDIVMAAAQAQILMYLLFRTNSQNRLNFIIFKLEFYYFLRQFLLMSYQSIDLS